MTPLLSTDSFDAFSTDYGFLIREKKKSAKKISLVVIVMGIVFFGISLIDLTTIVPPLLYKFFFYVFRWGSILLVVLGVITFLVKGMAMPNAEVIIDKQKREINLRGKVIPFAEINSVSMQTQEMFGKKMTIIILDHQGKKKAFVSGSLLTDGITQGQIAHFVNEVHRLVKS
jgi:hypothetical protein